MPSEVHLNDITACRLGYAEGVQTLLTALLNGAYSDDRLCTSVNLKLIITKCEQQCYRGSV